MVTLKKNHIIGSVVSIIFFFRLYARSLQKWLFLGKRLIVYSWLRANIKILFKFIWDYFLWKFKATLSVANRYDDFVRDFGECTQRIQSFVHLLSLFCTSVSKATSIFTGMNVAYYMRYHGWVDNWKIEMHPLCPSICT